MIEISSIRASGLEIDATKWLTHNGEVCREQKTASFGTNGDLTSTVFFEEYFAPITQHSHRLFYTLKILSLLTIRKGFERKTKWLHLTNISSKTHASEC